MATSSYYNFLLKECKRMHKMMQLNFLYKKHMFPFMQLYVHYVNLMKKKITWKVQSLEILKNKPTREIIPLLNNLAFFLCPLSSKFRCISHMQKIIMWKNMFSWF